MVRPADSDHELYTIASNYAYYQIHVTYASLP